MGAAFPLERENLFYACLKFSDEIKRTEIIHTSTRANVVHEILFIDLKFSKPNSLTLEERFLNSVRMTCG